MLSPHEPLLDVSGVHLSGVDLLQMSEDLLVCNAASIEYDRVLVVQGLNHELLGLATLDGCSDATRQGIQTYLLITAGTYHCRIALRNMISLSLQGRFAKDCSGFR